MPLTVRTPADLLACVPLLLGFLPEESAVLVSLPPGAGPHARVDLHEETDLRDLSRALLSPVRRHAVSRVAVVTYGPLSLSRRAADHLRTEFVREGVEVVAAVAANGTHWVSLTPPGHGTAPREYDALSHPFVTEAVVRGQVVLGSRGAVRALLAPDPRLVREVDALLGRGPSRAGVVQVARRVSAEWALDCLAGHVRDGTLPEISEIARLLRAVAQNDGRDNAWAWAERADARHHVEIWVRVLRGCAPAHRAEAAGVLAFHAWLAGDGALAWCAVEASQASEGECSLTTLVEDLLTKAAPPSAWTPLLRLSPQNAGDARHEGSGQVLRLPPRTDPHGGAA